MDEETRHYYASEAETLVRQLQDTKLEHWFRDPIPDTIVTDGEGFPPVQVIAREPRSKTFKYLRLKRDSSTEVTKDASLRVLIAAANGNGFVNDAAKNLTRLRPHRWCSPASRSGRVNFGTDSTRQQGLGATILLSSAPRG